MPAGVARIAFPHRQVDPRRSIVIRIGIAVGIVFVVAVLTWIQRDGFHDADGTPLTFLDSVYYSTVAVTSTGYGDIVPFSPAARATTAFLVTPLRVMFFVVLVGTTLSLLTERAREARAEARWRRRVQAHIIVAGYGTTGRGAIEAVLADRSAVRTDIVVIDQKAEAIAAANENGLKAILADATLTAAWTQARVDSARAVVISCNRDDTSALVTLTVRELNATVPISVTITQSENAHLLQQSGANTVILSSEAAGRLVGLATSTPGAVSVLEDLLAAGTGL
ncbi:MAG TPA: potassium channel family protein, partial [Acidimicrobiales bacterium]|nr:potassium channel family protein [Acidimicrobiales bacterium]